MSKDQQQEGVVQLAWIQAKGCFGDPVVLSEIETKDFVLEYGTAYQGMVKSGRRWQEASLSPDRLGIASVAINPGGVISGGIWCLAEEAETARALLVSAIRGCLLDVQKSIQSTLDSLPDLEPEADFEASSPKP